MTSLTRGHIGDENTRTSGLGKCPDGWQSLRTRSYSEGDADPDISSGNGPAFWKRGYVEVEVCSGTGVAACAFLFKGAYGNRLRVTTEGEGIAEGESAVYGHRLSLRVRLLKAYLPAATKNGMPRAPHHKLFMHGPG